jgi:hypothetical protein
VYPLWSTLWKLFRQLKIGSPYDPATPLGYTSKEYKISMFGMSSYPCLFAALIQVSSTDECIIKMWYIILTYNIKRILKREKSIKSYNLLQLGLIWRKFCSEK